MNWVRSKDGATVDRRAHHLPAEAWVQTSEDPPQGQFVPINEGNATAHGWFPFLLVEQPSPDHVMSIERVGDDFTQVWTFDQERADQRAAGEADEADRATVRAAVAQLSTFINLASPTAAQTRDQTVLHARILRRLIRDVMGDR